MSYRPIPGSLPHRVCSFLHANRDEELTRMDIASKFSCPPGSIDAALQLAMQHQVLARRNDADQGCIVIFAGPKMNEFNPGDAATAEPAGKQLGTALRQANKPKRPRVCLPHPDLAAITVQYDQPMPKSQRAILGANKYADLLAKLDRVNASVTLPVAYRGALQKAVIKHAKDHPQATTKYVVRTVDADTIGVWRTE